jgi:hypothetical protein
MMMNSNKEESSGGPKREPVQWDLFVNRPPEWHERMRGYAMEAARLHIPAGFPRRRYALLREGNLTKAAAAEEVRREMREAEKARGDRPRLELPPEKPE